MSGVETRQLVEANVKHLYVLNGSYSATGNTKVFTIISSYDETEENYIEVYNVQMNTHSERNSSNPSCIWGYAGNKPLNIKVYNSNITSEAINTSKAIGIIITHDLNKTETARIDIVDCNISATGTDGGDSSAMGVCLQNQKSISRIVNTTIKGITQGLDTHGKTYIKNCKCYSPYHGGVYNAYSPAVLYAENTEFHRSATPTGYTPSGTGCAYFGYGSTAYLNNCKFIRDVESDISSGIVVRKEGTPEGETTRVFVSNSEMPSIRCDAEQEIYLGNGISDIIKNATVQGTKYLTDNNYVYIEESNTAYSLLNPNAIVANQSYVTTELEKKQDKFADIRSDTTYDILRGTKNVLGFANNTEEASTIALAPSSIILQYNATGTEGLSNIFFLNNRVAKFTTTGTNTYLPVLGVATPVATADTDKGITADDIYYQAANKKYVDDSIATQVSSVYKAKGSIADISALPTPDKAHEGFVYNIENEFTTTDLFVEGAGKTYPAGTNVVCINTTGTTYKWDVLAGMVDLSNYATKTDLSGKLDKVTSVGTYRRAYAIMPNGTGYIQEIDYNATASTLALRDSNGALRAATPTTSSGGDIVATKKYVDDAIGNINSILATMFNDVSTQSDEEPTDDEEVIA